MLNALNFVTREKSSGGSTPKNVEVSVTFIKKGETISFSFSDTACRYLSNPSHIIAASNGNRIYFKAADKTTGFKMSSSASTSRKASDISAKKLGVGTAWIGYYRLEYDKELGLFYIDLNGKGC